MTTINSQNPIIAIYSRQAYPSAPVLSSISSFAGSLINTLLICSPNADNGCIVYNNMPFQMFDENGNYTGDQNWGYALAQLKSESNIRNLIFSINDNTIPVLAGMSDTGFQKVMLSLQRLGINGIDFDCESLMPTDLHVVKVTNSLITYNQNATNNPFLITASPFRTPELWQTWCANITKQGSTVAWLNVQCYSGGSGNDPIVQWAAQFSNIPIVAGFEPTNSGSDGGQYSPYEALNQLKVWQAEQPPVSLAGAFIWDYGILMSGIANLSDYAKAIQIGIQAG